MNTAIGLVCHRVIGEYELAPGSKVATVCKRCKARNEVEMEGTEVKRVTGATETCGELRRDGAIRRAVLKSQ